MRQSRGWLPTTILAVATATSALFLAACAGPTATTAPTATAAVAASAPAAPGPDAPVASNTVAIQNFEFSPATVTVKAGTTITWTNQDSDAHTVTSMNNGPLHSPPLNTGQAFHYTFTTPGRFDYLCTIHPFMTATVVVTP